MVFLFVLTELGFFWRVVYRFSTVNACITLKEWALTRFKLTSWIGDAT